MTVSMIIGGGQSKRMGQDKSALRISGRSLLERAIDAVQFSEEIVVAAAPSVVQRAPDWPPVHFVPEDPPFGGPVAGLVAGLDAWREREDDTNVIVLPVDMPDFVMAVDHLRTAQPSTDGVVLEDEEGWPQYLLGRYRLGALRRAARQLGAGRNISMRKFGQLLQVETIAVPNSVLVDVDTPPEAKAHGIEMESRQRKDDPEVMARLDKWQIALRAELDISEELFDQETILDLSTVIARQVARPAVPVTSYLAGIAIGRAIERGEDTAEAIERVLAIAHNPNELLPEETENPS